MVFEYLCSKCEASSIFKQIGGLTDKKCRRCDAKLNLQKDLVRYERDKDGDMEIILHERVERLIIAVGDIAERLGRLETQIFGEPDDEDLVTNN